MGNILSSSPPLIHAPLLAVLLMFITHKRDARHARLMQDVSELQIGLLQMNAASLNCLLWRVALQRALRLPAAQVIS